MSTRSLRLVLRTTALLIALPALAHAHPGHDGGHELTWDFTGGFGHPLFGIDHLMAMIAVGLWAAQIGGRARWLVPATFVGVMALGALLGNQGAVLPGVEQMIAASLLVLGLLLASARRLPLAAGLGLTALFAIFHGFAHGAEIPASASGLAYGFGFVIATVLLHGLGLALGQVGAGRLAWVRQTAGVGLAAAGAVLLVV